MQAMTNKTPMVCINDQPKIKQWDKQHADLNYSSNDASAMMVQASKTNEVNGIYHHWSTG